ncbi:TetR/AcrR family transcriptional regulator [Streptomyces sp. NPDC002643]
MKAQAKRVQNARGEGERLRREILEAATRVLEDTGREDALSLRAVAREVGISAPSVYLHFKDKTELVSTVLEAAYRTLAAAMADAGKEATAAGTGPWERIRAAVAAYRRFAVDNPLRYRLMFSLEYEPRHRPADSNPLSTVFGTWTGIVDTYLAAVQPELRPEAEMLGIHLWTALHGQLVLWRTLPNTHTVSEDILIELEESLLRRLLPAPS